MTMSILTKRWLQGGRSYRRRGLLIPLSAALCGGGLALTLAAGPAAAQTATAPPQPGVTLGAAAPSASSLAVFYTGTDGRVYAKVPGHAAVLAGGHLIGGPAAAWFFPGTEGRAGNLALFGRGTDNALWWAPSQFLWSRWQSLGGRITSKPAVAVDTTGRFYGVFARGTDGAVWARYEGTNGATWGPWQRLGGHLLPGTAPAATYVGHGSGVGGTDIVVVGTDRRVWLDRGGFPGNGDWASIGGRTTSDPAITSTNGMYALAFARGTDNAAWYDELPGNAPQGWHSLGGRLTSGVTTATPAIGPADQVGPTTVAVLGADNQIWTRSGVWPALGDWTRF
jgi:hypothetical protein